jgi:hypothetical protein
MRQLLNPDTEFSALFDTITENSWRWECQGRYEVDMWKVRRWEAGQAYQETDGSRSWTAYIQGLTDRGIPFERVRMLTEPLTDYLQWMLTTTQRNIDAGEEIRWVTQSRAHELGMPDYDFYLFDNNRVALLRFDKAKVLSGVELVDDPDVIDRHQRWRDLVWQHSVRHQDYRPAR